MKIKWTGVSVSGMFHNHSAGIQTGQVIDTDKPGDYAIDEIQARRYIRAELAVPADHDAAGAHF